MAVFEMPIARRGETELISSAAGPLEIELKFAFTGSEDDATAQANFVAAVGSTVPATRSGLALLRYRFEEQGNGVYHFYPLYGRPGAIGGSDPGTTRINF